METADTLWNQEFYRDENSCSWWCVGQVFPTGPQCCPGKIQNRNHRSQLQRCSATYQKYQKRPQFGFKGQKVGGYFRSSGGSQTTRMLIGQYLIIL